MATLGLDNNAITRTASLPNTPPRPRMEKIGTTSMKVGLVSSGPQTIMEMETTTIIAVLLVSIIAAALPMQALMTMMVVGRVLSRVEEGVVIFQLVQKFLVRMKVLVLG